MTETSRVRLIEGGRRGKLSPRAPARAILGRNREAHSCAAAARSAACGFTIALAAVVTGGCGGAGQQTTEEVFAGAPVVLISIDTLRSDRLPAYGYTAVETPAIDAFRCDAILFERAYSHYPLTLPSHVSLLSGMLPPEHGVRDNVGYRVDAAKVPLLARRLKGLGYRTGAAVSTYILRADAGLAAGFDFYDDAIDLRGDASLAQSQRPGTVTAARAIEWLRAAASERFFLFLHLYEPHTPWQAPEPFASRYAAEPYDGEVAAADAIVGELIAELERLGVYERAIVVLTSDHGEGLGDHGELEHGILLYREALQVPLLLKLPGSRHGGTTVRAAAQLADVAPTFLDLLGAPVEGRTTLLDLLGPDAPARAVYAETYYPRLHLGWSDLASLFEGPLHYIEGPDPELYDLGADPGERQNVLAARRRDYAALRDAIKPLRRELAAPSAVDEATARRLAALGYLAGGAAARSGPLPDPKTNLGVLADLVEALRAQTERRHADAVARFQRVLERNPEMADAWENLARSFHELGRLSEAVEAYRRALDLSGGADHVALNLGRLYLQMGEAEQARAHAELGLATNPAAAHQLLAQVALAERDLAAAERHAAEARAARESTIAPLVLLAQVAVERGDLARAADLIARAEAEQARREGGETTPGLLLTKGDILARQGEAEAAEAALLGEIREHPEDPRAYSRLALLYALEGRNEEAVAALRRMVEGLGTPAAYATAIETLRVLGDPRSASALLRRAHELFPGNPKLEALAVHPG